MRPKALIATVGLALLPSISLAQDFADRPARECEQFPQPALEGAWSNWFWPAGVVPYEFDANTTPDMQAAMRAAMNEIQAVCGAVFVPRTTQADYLHIQNANRNASYVGPIGGGQPLWIYNWNYRFIMCHELMHAMGLWHEQSRPDRDAYVIINYDNIQPQYAHNFDANDSAPTGPFDFDSVMLYGACSFSVCCPTGTICPCPTECAAIQARPAYAQYQNSMGQRSRLSVGDAQGLLSRYPHTVFTDWMSAGEDTASGMLGAAAVNIYSSTSGAFDGTVTDESSDYFNNENFQPQLATSDLLALKVTPSGTIYSITFSRPVLDPVIHLLSFDSTASFDAPFIQKLSGDSTLTVTGNQVFGVTIGPPPAIYNDSNGTITIPGLYSSLSFTLKYNVSTQGDGIYAQIGGTPCADFAQQPAEASACPTGSATFEVIPDGGSPTFQWQIDDPSAPDGWANIYDGPISRNGENVGTISGATTSLARWDGIYTSGNGSPEWRTSGASFRCIISNACGPVPSQSAALHICQGDLNCDSITDFADFLFFFNCFDTNNICGDVDGDGSTEFGDFLAFFNSFDVGC
jgi:hypothetical protein